MIAADRQRRDAGVGEAVEERDDVGLGGGVVEQRVEPRVADVGDAAERERIDAKDVMRRAHQRGEIAHRARPVAGAGAVGRAAVEGNAGDADVDAWQIELVRRAHEGRDFGEARREARVVVARRS